MPTSARGITILLTDSARTTPLKVANVKGMSFSVELRTLDLRIYRFDAQEGYLPLVNYPVRLNLLTSNQQDQIVTGQDGIIRTFFPDSDISVALEATAAPPDHKAILNYSLRTAKRNELTVVFIPDSIRRFYPRLTVL
jgi:hypothetical protein